MIDRLLSIDTSLVSGTNDYADDYVSMAFQRLNGYNIPETIYYIKKL